MGKIGGVQTFLNCSYLSSFPLKSQWVMRTFVFLLPCSFACVLPLWIENSKQRRGEVKQYRVLLKTIVDSWLQRGCGRYLESKLCYFFIKSIACRDTNGFFFLGMDDGHEFLRLDWNFTGWFRPPRRNSWDFGDYFCYCQWGLQILFFISLLNIAIFLYKLKVTDSRVSPLLFCFLPLLLQLMPIYRHSRKALEFFMWEDGGHFDPICMDSISFMLSIFVVQHNEKRAHTKM
ncbi:hypothetical protein DVH24_038096 [Malus domestica]|uniref:Uncharacterized protein n=1 Tax=Malus domestica TaxID=3750 RepID=A0A498KE64_MALDO|nr:hypothetical protein DVH24_038096 [Malus domestica]